MRKVSYNELVCSIEEKRNAIMEDYWETYKGKKMKKSFRSEDEKKALTELAKAQWNKNVKKIGERKYHYDFPY